MPITSKAVVIPRRNVIELSNVRLVCPVDSLSKKNVLIQTAFTSISAGTERMLLDGRMPHPALSFPLVPGYETVGRVIEVGEEAPKELLGEWVYVGGARCFEGVNPAWGGQSEYIYTEADRVVTLDGLAPDIGIILALSATSLHGINLAEIQESDHVVVMGQGIVGQITARLARLAGAGYVSVVDRIDVRLAVSQADHVINIAREALEEAIGSNKIDVLIEATGSMDALKGALPLLAEHGRVVLLGYYDHIHVPYAPLFMREARILVAREWVHGPQGDLPQIRDMLASGRLDVQGLLTHRVPLERIRAAYRLALEDPSCLKVVVEWPIDEDTSAN